MSLTARRTLRALLTGHAPGAAAWHAVAWSVAICVGSVLVAGLLFRRRVS